MANIRGTAGADNLVAPNAREDDVIVALAGNDRIEARGGDDWINPGPGNDRVEGGDGEDTVVYSGEVEQYQVWRRPGEDELDEGILDGTEFSNREAVVVGPDGIDSLRDAEVLSFRAAAGSPLPRVEFELGRMPEFPAFAYLASQPDVLAEVGADEQAAFTHFVNFGAAEGRDITFDPYAYMASNPDLIVAFDGDARAAARHYVLFGQDEGRNPGTLFDAQAYMDANPDVRAAYGGNAALAIRHYVEFGFEEGRGAGDVWAYTASYDDLIEAFADDPRMAGWHSLTLGQEEGRQITFDGLQYVAGYDDLARAFGRLGSAEAIETAGEQHFVTQGKEEGRARDNFDEQQYAANYPDLAAAGLDTPDELALHYIRTGLQEGRTDEPLIG